MPVETLPVELTKGANVALRDLDEELGSVSAVLETASRDGEVLDADVSVLLLGADGRVRSNADMVFYNQRAAVEGAIRLRDKVRTTVDGYEAILDTVTVTLDDVSDDIDRIVLLASIDPDLDASFGAASRIRLRIQRSSDAQDLAAYTVGDVATETALLFGEFYRRAGQWRLRAIGQGYGGGLAQAARDFGVELDGEAQNNDRALREGASPDGVETTIAEPAVAASTSESSDGEQPKTSARRLSTSRPRRPPKMPATWRRTIPADDEDDWKTARLFPVAGIGGAEEQEQRATSALLAVAALVKEFGRALVAAMGGRPGVIESFTEVRFGHEDKTVRPDGVMCSTWGKRVWTALIEVKTAGELSAAQIDSYVEVARSKGYDAVVMISNDLTVSADEFPIEIDRRKLKKVALRHLGWDEIRTIAQRCLEHDGVADATQRRVLAEFLRYMQHPRSGVHGFIDMGKHWVSIRDSAKNKTLRPGDRGSTEIINNYDQAVRRAGLYLSALLGVDVQTTQPAPLDSSSRCQQFADSGVLFGSIRVPGAIDDLIVGMDVRAERISCAVTVPAPGDGRPLTRLNWLLRQLSASPDALRIEATLAGGRGLSTAESLKTARLRPELLLPQDSREIRAFRLTLECPMSNRRDAGRSAIVGAVESAVCRFYADVLQHVQRWSGSRPPQLTG